MKLIWNPGREKNWSPLSQEQKIYARSHLNIEDVVTKTVRSPWCTGTMYRHYFLYSALYTDLYMFRHSPPSGNK
jgi:hypothetical protein